MELRNLVPATHLQHTAVPENQGFYYEIVSPSNIRSYTHDLLPTWSPNHELNKENTNEHAKLCGKKNTKPQLNSTQRTTDKE